MEDLEIVVDSYEIVERICEGDFTRIGEILPDVLELIVAENDDQAKDQRLLN